VGQPQRSPLKQGFNYSTAGRLHPFDHVAGILLNLPLILLGFNPIIVLTVGLLGPGLSLFFHTQYVKKLPRPIEYIFNTPSHHRVHHASQKQYLDSNFGAIFMVWDRAFGSYAEEEDLPEYGLTKPIDTQNPVKVMSHGWVEMIHDVRAGNSPSERVKHLVKRPGWSPDRSQLGQQKDRSTAQDQAKTNELTGV
jgi:sterol desaturase/sphingolipid hydroxylase (fatty acid hydroxylase superfamily)